MPAGEVTMRLVRVFVRRGACGWLWGSVLLAVGCAAETDDPMDPTRVGAAAQNIAGSGADAAPTFGEVYGILEMHCGGGMSGCHIGGTAAGLGLPDVELAHDRLVEAASAKCAGEMLVAPGDPDASVLVQVLEGTSECVRPMPLGRDPLSEDAIATIRAWIDGGAAAD